MQDLKFSFDRLVIATGSQPFRPPIRGLEKKGVFAFRSLDDTEVMLAYARPGMKALVIGGGLLGLEAARGLACRGLAVGLAHISGRLMEKQLGPPAAALLKREMADLGIEVLLDHAAEAVLGDDSAQGVHFSNGSLCRTDLVVVAAGIRANAELAAGAGLEVNQGVIVDDYLETSAPA